MDQAVKSDLAYVQRHCPPGVYKSVWDRLCKQLFGILPIGMNGEEQIPNIDIWKDGVVLTDSSDPYSFTIYSEEAPKTGDVIEYKGRFFIVGTVED